MELIFNLDDKMRLKAKDVAMAAREIASLY